MLSSSAPGRPSRHSRGWRRGNPSPHPEPTSYTIPSPRRHQKAPSGEARCASVAGGPSSPPSVRLECEMRRRDGVLPDAARARRAVRQPEAARAVARPWRLREGLASGRRRGHGSIADLVLRARSRSPLLGRRVTVGGLLLAEIWQRRPGSSRSRQGWRRPVHER